MVTIRAEHVTRLLGPEGGNPVLIVHEGRAEVVEAERLSDPRYAGALRVTDRADLGAEVGGEPLTEERAQDLARRLDAAVSNLGG